MSSTAGFEGCAVMGGICHIVCFAPQLYHMYKTKIAGGFDQRYFILCLFGSILEFMYLIFHGAWAAWVPLLFMVCFFMFDKEHYLA